MLLHGLKPGLGVHRQAPGRKPTASASLNPLSRISKGSCLQGLLFLALKPLFSSVQFGCSIVSNSATSWTAAYQAPPSMGFSRQEYWSGMPFSSVQLLRRVRLFATP